MAWKVRIEFVRHARENFQRGAGGAEPWRFYAAQTLSGSGATVVTSAAAPAFTAFNDGVQSGFARVSVISGAVVLAWGAGASSGELAGVRLQAGDRQDFEVATGDVLSFVEAADAPVSIGGGGGSGGPSTLADGADATQGATTDAAWNGSGASTVVGLLKGAYAKLAGTLPVSAAALPLPAGAATSAKQDAMTTALGSPLQAGGAVSVSNLPATQPVSATALPLPSGAATSALQSANGGKLDQLHTDLIAATPAGSNFIGKIAPSFAVVSASVTRPADTTAYAALDLIANSTTAGSVVPMSFAAALGNDRPLKITRARVSINDANWQNNTIRLWLFRVSPTVANGDNGGFSPSESACLGYIDMNASLLTSDSYADGWGVPQPGGQIIALPTSGAQSIFGLAQVITAPATQGSGKTYTFTLEVEQG